MALSDETQNIITDFTSAVSENYDQLIMGELHKWLVNQGSLTNEENIYRNQEKYQLLKDGKGEAPNKSLFDFENSLSTSWAHYYMPPRSLFKILDGIMWPAISKIDGNGSFMNGLNADGSPNVEGNTMRGVSNKWLWQEGIPGIKENFSKYNAIESLNTKSEALVSRLELIRQTNTTTDADKNEILQALFTEEVMAKAVFILSYCCENRVSESCKNLYPIQLMAADPFLGYAFALTNWMGGDNAIKDRGLVPSLRKISSTFEYLKVVDGNPQAFGVGGNEFLDAYYKWLMTKKDAANYDQLTKQFIDNPQSLINMFVVLNERALLDASNAYSFPAPSKSHLGTLGTNRKSFKMTLG